jgi:hypothetical protein
MKRRSKSISGDVEGLIEMGPMLSDRIGDAGPQSRPPGSRGAGRKNRCWAHSPEDNPTTLLAAELLKVRGRDGQDRPLLANAAQRLFERNRGASNIVLKARQMGMTTWIGGRFFLKTITGRGVTTVQVAQTKEAAEGIFRIVQRFWERLPVELRKGALRRSVANVGAMRFPELDSEFLVASAADGNAGRGLTIHNLHCSEVSRWPGDASETLSGLRAALVPGGELVLESTPNGAYGCFHEEWMKAVEPGEWTAGSAQMVRHFFPWWMEASYVSVPVTDPTAEELRLIAAHNLSPAQIGYRRYLETGYKRMRSQEFAEDATTCFRATGECCFDIDRIEERLAEVTDAAETRRGGALRIWLSVLPGRQYLVGVDTAGGGPDGDFAAVQVIDLESGLQCAELVERLGAMELARVSAELAREYNHSLIAVERNNHGAAVLAYLDAVEHCTNLYRQGGVPGWLTTQASKPAMVSRMGALLAQSPEIFASARLLGECRSFVVFTGGATGAANGAHDDCFMAMAVAQSVRVELQVRAGKQTAAERT